MLRIAGKMLGGNIFSQGILTHSDITASMPQIGFELKQHSFSILTFAISYHLIPSYCMYVFVES